MGNLTSRPDHMTHPDSVSRDDIRKGPTPSQIIEVQQILIQVGRLPSELAIQILNEAEYWTQDIIRSDTTLIVQDGRMSVFDIDLVLDLTYMYNVLARYRDQLVENEADEVDTNERTDDRPSKFGNGWGAKIVKMEWSVVSHDQVGNFSIPSYKISVHYVCS